MINFLHRQNKLFFVNNFLLFSMTNKLPNILVTGTPGTGKTTTAQLVAQELDLTHIEIGKIVKEHNLHDGFVEEFGSYEINEDLLLDYLEPLVAKGGVVVDHHGSDFFPLRYFDLVVCLSCDNTVLYDRLVQRGYPQKKIQENVECEIMKVCLEEATESFPNVVELSSNTLEEMDSNVERIEQWFHIHMSRS
jgi:broad-specificity NMP kinase